MGLVKCGLHTNMHISITIVELSRQDLPMLSANDVQIPAQALLTGNANIKKLGNIKKERNIKSRDLVFSVDLYQGLNSLSDRSFSGEGSSLQPAQELGGGHCF